MSLPLFQSSTVGFATNLAKKGIAEMQSKPQIHLSEVLVAQGHSNIPAALNIWGITKKNTMANDPIDKAMRLLQSSSRYQKRIA